MKALVKKIIFNNLFCFIFSFFCYAFSKKEKQQDTQEIADASIAFYNPPHSSCIRKKYLKNSHKFNLQIIIPCYNAEAYLKKCIDSVLNFKSRFSINILLVDDGSTDKSGFICDDYAKKFSNITVVHQQNGGFSSARNAGLEYINSDFLMFLDSDDYLFDKLDLDSLIEKSYKLSTAKRRNIILEFGFKRERDNKRFGTYLPPKGFFGPTRYTGFAWGKIFPSSLFEAIKFPLNYWFEDTFIKMIVLFIENVSVFGVPTIGYIYRDNCGSITHNYRKSKKVMDSFYIMESLLCDAKKIGISFDSQYSDILMWQIVCTFIRTQNIDDKIDNVIYKKTRTLLIEYGICQPKSLKYYFLYKSILNNKANCYSMICRLLSKSK